MKLQKFELRRLQNRRAKIDKAPCKLIDVRRVNGSLLQRIEKVIVMLIPKAFTLNDVHHAMMEVADAYPCSEDYIVQKGGMFICYRDDIAKAMAASGFLYKKKKKMPIYQTWGGQYAA